MMPGIRIEWDPKKNEFNKQKHGISFEEAETVFSDEHGLLVPDSDHSKNEERFVLLGMSLRLRILVVCHSYREEDDVVRIFSARKANKSEQSQYHQRWT